jgi:hypothetical protein
VTSKEAPEHVDVSVTEGEIVAALVNTLFRLAGGVLTVPTADFQAEIMALKRGHRTALRPADGPEDTITFHAVRARPSN